MPPMPTVTVKSGYKPQSIDTSIMADVLMFQLLRQLTPQLKVQRTCAFNRPLAKKICVFLKSLLTFRSNFDLLGLLASP